MAFHKIGELKATCGKCGTVLAIDEANPPKDDDVITCGKCGELFGFYALLRDRIEAEAKVEAGKWFDETFNPKSRK